LVVGKQCEPPSWLEQVLKSQDRTQAGRKVAAKGLYLVDVGYAKHYNIPNSKIL
jgi:tRNA U38,U39,U40 pseudouridine synthase TruA